MPESERQRAARERKEFLEQANRDELARKNKARQASADAQAEQEERAGKNLDDQFMADAKAFFGDDLREVEENIRLAPTSAEKAQAQAALDQALAAARGGLFRGKNPAKASKILKKNKSKIKKVSAQGKAKRGCFAVFVSLAAVGAAVAYGMYEGVSAIASGLF